MSLRRDEAEPILAIWFYWVGMDAAGTLFVVPTPGRSTAVVGSIGVTGLFRARCRDVHA